MSVSVESLLVLNRADENALLHKSPRQRRRSNSSSDILAHANIKAVKSPRRDASHKDYLIPRPPRLALGTQPFTPKIPMTPPTQQEYKKYINPNMLYCNDASMLRGGSQYPSPRVTRTTSFGSNTSTNSGRSISTGVYNECIKKTTSFDDEDSVTDSCSSSDLAEDDDESSCGAIDSALAKEVCILRKEIDSVKNSLAGLQKDHVEMLNEKKQLEEQYHEAKEEVKKTLETSTNELMSYNRLLNEKMEKLSLELANVSPSDISPEDGGEWPEAYNTIMNNCFNQAKELELLQSQLEKSKEDFRVLLNVKDDIERTLEAKEREYLEQIRQCEAVTNGQAGMIDSMEFLLRDLEGKMDKLINEKIQQQQAAATGKKKTHRKQKSSISSTASSLRRQNSYSEHSHSKKQPSSPLLPQNISGRSTPSKHRHRSSISSLASAVIEREQIRPVSPAPSTTSNHPASDLAPSYCLSPPHSRPQPVTNPISLLTDEVRIEHQARFSLAKRWIEDDEVSTCQHESCDVRFNFWRRRHHCRRCGNIFCHIHSDYSMLLFDGNEDWNGVWSRVCEGCFKQNK